LIVDGKDIPGPNTAVDETPSMQIHQCFQKGFQQVPCFRRRERAFWQELRQVLRSIFHHDIQQIHSRQLAAAAFKQADQVGMRNLRRLLPTRQLDLGLCGLRLNELDRGLFRSIFSALRQKHDAMIGTAQVLE